MIRRARAGVNFWVTLGERVERSPKRRWLCNMQVAKTGGSDLIGALSLRNSLGFAKHHTRPKTAQLSPDRLRLPTGEPYRFEVDRLLWNRFRSNSNRDQRLQSRVSPTTFVQVAVNMVFFAPTVSFGYAKCTPWMDIMTVISYSHTDPSFRPTSSWLIVTTSLQTKQGGSHCFLHLPSVDVRNVT